MQDDVVPGLTALHPRARSLVARVAHVADVRMTAPKVVDEVRIFHPDEAFAAALFVLPRQLVREPGHHSSEVGATVAIRRDGARALVVLPRSLGSLMQE